MCDLTCTSVIQDNTETSSLYQISVSGWRVTGKQNTSVSWLQPSVTLHKISFLGWIVICGVPKHSASVGLLRTWIEDIRTTACPCRFGWQMRLLQEKVVEVLWFWTEQMQTSSKPVIKNQLKRLISPCSAWEPVFTPASAVRLQSSRFCPLERLLHACWQTDNFVSDQQASIRHFFCPSFEVLLNYFEKETKFNFKHEGNKREIPLIFKGLQIRKSKISQIKPSKWKDLFRIIILWTYNL